MAAAVACVHIFSLSLEAKANIKHSTHIWECILISRKKKAKQVEDEEKARVALTSPTFASPIYSNFAAAKPVAGAGAGVPAGSQPMKQATAAFTNSQNNGFRKLQRSHYLIFFD